MVGSSVRSQQSGIVPPVNSLASSKVSLNATSFRDAFDGGVWDEDVTIAESLLAGNPPHIPPRRTSFLNVSSSKPMSVDENASTTTHSVDPPRRRMHNLSSNTWTSSSAELSETDDVDERATFVYEYNKIANQYGINVLVPDAYEPINYDKVTITGKQSSWLMRRILKRTSSMLAIKNVQKDVKHKRSISDFSLRLQAAKRDSLKDKHLVELVRLCGSSPFYLPTEYAAGTLTLPTCFRATAQYLVQRGPSVRGIFRINGSHAIVSALYDHYASQDEDGDAISGTVRCPTLPENIQCDEHDVASAFKRFLAGLPGGILGKVWLFESLVSIHNQLGVDPEWTKTRQTKVRARLIACAISSHQSRFQRDLICAVFGLLCMIGRAAETADREDDNGRPLPTHGLMGYSVLGTLFGPLLLGDLMKEYQPYHDDKRVDSALGKATNKKEKKTKQQKKKSLEESLNESRLAAEKIRIANRVAEMVITHWRDVVRHMKSMGSMASNVLHNRTLAERQKPAHPLQPILRPSASESFFQKRPPMWDTDSLPLRTAFGVMSPPPLEQNIMTRPRPQSMLPLLSTNLDSQTLRRQRTRPRSSSFQMLSGAKSMSVLTPPKEDRSETAYDDLNVRIQAIKHDKQAEENHTSPTRKSDHRLSATAAAQSESSIHEQTLGEYSLLPSIGTTESQPHEEQRRSLSKYEISRATTAVTETPVESTQPPPPPQILEPQPLKEVSSQNRFAALRNSFDALHSSKSDATASSRNSSSESQPLRSRVNLVPGVLPSSVDRLDYQTPSEHFERILSLHATPSEKLRRTGRFGATDPGVSTYQQGGYSSSDPSEEYVTHRSYEAPPTAYSRSRYNKDPLQRISKAEDMASLASLGRAMMTPNDGSADVSSAENPPRKVDNTLVSSQATFPSALGSVSHTMQTSLSEGSGKMKDVAVPSAELSIFPTPVKRVRSPFTSTGETMKAATVLKGRLNSVKSLAAKFDKPQGSPQPSPTRPARPRGSASQPHPPVAPVSSVLAGYTTNPSPSPSRASMKSRNSMISAPASRQRTRENCVYSPRRTPVLQNPDDGRSRSRLADRLLRAATCSPRSPTKRQSSKNSVASEDSGEEQKHVSDNLSAVASTLANSGDATRSFSTVRNTLTKKLPHPAEPPVAQHLPLPRPPSDSFPQPSTSPLPSSEPRSSGDSSLISPAFYQPFQRNTSAAPESTIPNRGRGTSMLFAQVTNLQKLVDNKTEEIVMLKRQLATKNTLNELGTLSEQLREARRETAMWKKRALMAEKRLERLSQMVPDSVHGLDDDTVSMLDTASEGVFIRHSLLSESGDDTGISLDSQGQAQVRRSMQHGGGGMDGVMSSEGSYESAGTVMITRRNRSSVNLLDFSSGVDVLGMELLQPLLPVKEGAKELEELQQPLMGAQHVSVHIEQMAELE